MKKFVPLFLVIITCIALTSCGGSKITGDLKTYSNAEKSFSIELPTANEKSWVTDKETPANILDVSDSKDSVNIRVQCLSKGQIEPVASDLEAYKDYAMTNTLGDVLADAKLEKGNSEVPKFITGSLIYDFNLSGKATGKVMFMESDKCFYTYMIMAVDKTYKSNEDILLESVLSLKEN